MSLTVSRGLTDAGRWTAVATTVAEHLDALDRAVKRRLNPPEVPVGAIAAARRFFEYVLEGIALDQKPSRGKNSSAASSGNGASAPIPTMAGISNLSIAVSVMRSARGDASTKDMEKVKQEITSFIETLRRLQLSDPEEVSPRDRSLLAKFFRELQREGEIERDSMIASQERPHRSIF